MKVGIDFGSKNIHFVLLDNDGKLLFRESIEHSGDISGAYGLALRKIEETHDGKISTLGVTGNIDLSGISVYDPVISAVEANRVLKTGCRNIISIGCESFYLIRLDENFNYVEHFVNSDCASGTGSFIDQQAERLGFTTEILSKKACEYNGNVPSIATRCAVFAKSDIIHAQAQGFSREAIATGLCKGVTRSVLANTVKGRDITGALVFTGGMSRNRKIIEEISESLNREVIVHEESVCFNAVGAAVLGEIPWEERSGLVSKIGEKREVREPLSINLENYPDFSTDNYYEKNNVEVTLYHSPEEASLDVYMGIDVGSTSTKMVITSTGGTILSGLYGRTKGDPVKAVIELLGELKSIYSKKELNIKGVATTGSGRELIRVLIGADLAINEITAHAKGSVFLDPGVDTIIEIGGQDSKFTLLENGEVISATMNYVCAAGTGSFIEEQAKRMDMTLKQISDVVPGKTAPFTSDRCTVYMERDLNIFISEGWNREQIMAAVLYSVRDNYLSKVVGKSVPGRKIYFQGATARNKALVAVFENELGQPVHVSRFCHLTGALGCAVSLMEDRRQESTFTGIDFSCNTSSEICKLCSNQCDLRIYTVGDTKTAWGLKCGRDYNDRKAGRTDTVSELESKFNDLFISPDIKTEDAPTIGIPETLFMMEYVPMFKDFFQRLGVNVVVEKSSGKKLETGMKMINADFCAPMALSHGLVQSLAEKGVDFIFFPAIINEQGYVKKLKDEEPFRNKYTDSYFCYYSSYAATIINNLPGYDYSQKLLLPKIKFNNRPEIVVANEIAVYFKDILNMDTGTIVDAFIEARNVFLEKQAQWILKGDDILSSKNDKLKILLLGRPYALFDKRVNLGIPSKLENMGFDLLNQTMFDFDKLKTHSTDHLDNMHWYFGQQVLLAMEAVKKYPDVYPVFLTCFRCSPDSYLMNYFKEFMQKIKKPYLILQLDEHSSDVGYLTRLEAAVDTFRNDFSRRKEENTQPHLSPVNYNPDVLKEGDTVLIPLTEERINRLQKEVFEMSGFSAKVIPLDREMLNQGYRYATGGECLPNIAIIGSLMDTFKNGTIDPEKSIVYLPNLCLSCNFNQYANLIKLSCRRAGLGQVRVMNTNGLSAVPGISARSNALLLSVTILCSILNKLRHRFEPYEVEKGLTKGVVEESEEIIRWHIRNKKSLFKAADKIRSLFDTLPLPEKRKPVIGILGDVYAKYNSVLNDSICEYAEALGGEILLPAYNELMLHTAHSDFVENIADEKLWKTMAGYEEKFETLFKGLIDDAFEPSLEDCRVLMEEFGLTSFITGETSVSVGRMLYYIKHRIVDAVLHVNPVFCCPGVISSSLFRKIQDVYNVPVIDLFYDGTNKPNKIIDPHMFYLTRKRGRHDAQIIMR